MKLQVIGAHSPKALVRIVRKMLKQLEAENVVAVRDVNLYFVPLDDDGADLNPAPELRVWRKEPKPLKTRS